MTAVSAYVPCFNNAATVGEALRSLQLQRVPVDELCLVDDGSSDGSRAIAKHMGVPVVELERNMGRGVARAAAIDRAQHELVISCDATNQLPVDFLHRALPWFADPQVAGVFGRIWQNQGSSLADRWRGRHLFKVQECLALQHGALLSTYGCVLRRSAVLEVGNFDRSLRHSEDADLGRRLLAAGFDVIFDPSLHVITSTSNTKRQVLERYWRWNAGAHEHVSLRGYAKQVWYSLRVMVFQDLRDGDLPAISLSLLCPHYQFWKSWCRRYLSWLQL